MLKQTSQEFRAMFLIAFTKELIQNSLKDFEVKPIQQIIKPTPQFQITPKQQPHFAVKIPQKQIFHEMINIPEPRLPPQLQYLQPTPTEIDLDLEKLNQLIKDPAVKSIICPGEDEKIIVKGIMGTKPTNITLTKNEIENIIEKFSNLSKIPFQEGIFRVAMGRLIMSAIVSNIISSKFIIRKMISPKLAEVVMQ